MEADAASAATGGRVLDQLADLHDFVAALPEGYGTRVGEGGGDLPGGVRTIVMATHSARLFGICHSIVVLEKGRIGRGGSAKDVLPELFGTPSAARAP